MRERLGTGLKVKSSSLVVGSSTCFFCVCALFWWRLWFLTQHFSIGFETFSTQKLSFQIENFIFQYIVFFWKKTRFWCIAVQALFALGILAHLLRMVSWNLNTLHFGSDYTPQSSSDVRWARIPRVECLEQASTMGTQNHEKWRFYTPNIWVITPKNEGFEFPWHVVQLWDVFWKPADSSLTCLLIFLPVYRSHTLRCIVVACSCEDDGIFWRLPLK